MAFCIDIPLWRVRPGEWLVFRGCVLPPLPVPDDHELQDISIPGAPPRGRENPVPPAVEQDGSARETALPAPHSGVKAKIEELAEADECIEGCDECAPRVRGFADWTRYAPEDAEFVGESAWNGFHYQHDICRLPYEPATSRILEWKFAAYSWDGFEPGSCTMLEAKYGYDTKLTHTYDAAIGSDGAEDSRYRTIPLTGLGVACVRNVSAFGRSGEETD